MAQAASDNSPLLAADSRAALLQALRAGGRPLSVGEAAAAVGISESTARSHLALLVTAGLVTRSVDRRSRVGRPALRYAPAPQAPASAGVDARDDLAQLRQLAGVLAGHIGGGADPAAAARTAGQRWSAELAGPEVAGDAGAGSVGATLMDLLGRLGFDPERPARDQIWLRRCPFEEVARQHRAVVCGVHLGMLEQTVEQLGGDARAVGLEPFTVDQPLLCIVRLAGGDRREDHGGAGGPGGDTDG